MPDAKEALHLLSDRRQANAGECDGGARGREEYNPWEERVRVLPCPHMLGEAADRADRAGDWGVAAEAKAATASTAGEYDDKTIAEMHAQDAEYEARVDRDAASGHTSADSADDTPEDTAKRSAEDTDTPHCDAATAATGGTPTTTTSRRSLLPAWLLDSARKLDAFNETLAKTQSSLAKLNTKLSEFDDAVLRQEAKDTAHAADTALTSRGGPSAIMRMPSDLGMVVVYALAYPSCMQLAASCTQMRELVLDEKGWRIRGKRRWFLRDDDGDGGDGGGGGSGSGDGKMLVVGGGAKAKRRASAGTAGGGDDGGDGDGENPRLSSSGGWRGGQSWRRRCADRYRALSDAVQLFRKMQQWSAVDNVIGSWMVEWKTTLTHLELLTRQMSDAQTRQRVREVGGIRVLVLFVRCESHMLRTLAASILANLLFRDPVAIHRVTSVDGIAPLRRLLGSPQARIQVNDRRNDRLRMIRY